VDALVAEAEVSKQEVERRKQSARPLTLAPDGAFSFTVAPGNVTELSIGSCSWRLRWIS
jgi:hypothetical protein